MVGFFGDAHAAIENVERQKLRAAHHRADGVLQNRDLFGAIHAANFEGAACRYRWRWRVIAGAAAARGFVVRIVVRVSMDFTFGMCVRHCLSRDGASAGYAIPSLLR
jgi:hypothetical protein